MNGLHLRGNKSWCLEWSLMFDFTRHINIKYCLKKNVPSYSRVLNLNFKGQKCFKIPEDININLFETEMYTWNKLFIYH